MGLAHGGRIMSGHSSTQPSERSCANRVLVLLGMRELLTLRAELNVSTALAQRCMRSLLADLVQPI
jgi:hypothetical protein